MADYRRSSSRDNRRRDEEDDYSSRRSRHAGPRSRSDRSAWSHSSSSVEDRGRRHDAPHRDDRARGGDVNMRRRSCSRSHSRSRSPRSSRVRQEAIRDRTPMSNLPVVPRREPSSSSNPYAHDQVRSSHRDTYGYNRDSRDQQRESRARSSRGQRDVFMRDADTTAPSLQLMSRPNTGEIGLRTSLEVNHYTVTIDRKLVYHFNLEFRKATPAQRGRGQFRRGPRSRGGSQARGGRPGSYAPFDDAPPPLPICVRLIRIIEDQNQHLLSRTVLAHDGKKNIYALVCDQLNGKVLNGEVDGKQYDVRFSLVNTIDFSEVSRYLQDGRGLSPQYVLQCFDTVARTAPLRSMLYTGRGFMAMLSDGESITAGGGIDVLPCSTSVFKITDSGLALNVDVHYSKFYSQITLLDFAIKVLNLNGSADDPNFVIPTFNHEQRRKLHNEFRGIKVCRSWAPISVDNPAVTIKSLSDKTANDAEYEEKNFGRKTVVERYDDIGQRLMHPHLPLVELRSGKDGSMKYPLEKALIAPGQRRERRMPIDLEGQVTRAAASDPSERRKLIKGKVQQHLNSSEAYFRQFGLTVNTTPKVIPGRILPPPRIEFGTGLAVMKPTKTNELSFSLRNQKFYRTEMKLDCWGILVTSDATKQEIKRFFELLKEVGLELGLSIEDPVFGRGSKYEIAKDVIKLHKKVVSKLDFCRLIMVVKPDMEETDYGQIKNVGECYLGVPTQCAVSANVQQPTRLYVRNLLLKINTKIGNVNWQVKLEDLKALKRTKLEKSPVAMVIGYTVTHAKQKEMKKPADGGDKSRPSIAAAVGALNPACTRWITSLRQCPATDSIITKAGDLICDLFEAHDKAMGYLPKAVIIYRNGISDGAFCAVLAEELEKIRMEVAKLGAKKGLNGYSPKITFIVTQKRQSLKIFPAKGEQTTALGNCLPGTIVDTDVTDRGKFEFYIMSHGVSKGVPVPIRYIALKDDLGFTADELQGLTYNLCFGFCRSTGPISVVPAVRYAELLSLRGRVHLDTRELYATMMGETSPQLKGLHESITEEIPTVKDTLHKVLYFV